MTSISDWEQRRERRRKRHKVFVIAFLVVWVCVMVWLQIRAYQERPVIAAAVAQAERDGEALLEAIGTPPGSTRLNPVEKRLGVRRHGTRPISVTYVTSYDAPGTHAEIDAWYKDRLPSLGWGLREPDVPTSVQIEFCRGKWLLTIGHSAWYPGHSHFSLRLQWDYRHDLGGPPEPEPLER